MHIHPSACSIIVGMVTVGLAFISALVAWSATAALAAYAQRRPSASAVGWLVAALGMAVGLSAGVIGVILGFGELTFRLLQIGISLLGPLYIAWGAVEFGVRSAQGRFTSRLLLSAFTVVPLVILFVDRVSGHFERAFPAMGEHYDLVPRAVLGAAHVLVIAFLAWAVIASARRLDGDRDRLTELSVLGLAALAALLSTLVGRVGLDVVGPLLALGSVAALWGACALAAGVPRRSAPRDDYDEYDDGADGDTEPYDDPREKPVRRRRHTSKSADYDDYYYDDEAPEPERIPPRLRGVITIYTLVDGQAPEFDRLTDAVVAEVSRREPDTLLFACHTVPSAPLQRIVYAIYRDELAQEEHERQPHVMEFARRGPAHVVATNVIELSLSGASASDSLVSMLMPH